MTTRHRLTIHFFFFFFLLSRRHPGTNVGGQGAARVPRLLRPPAHPAQPVPVRIVLSSLEVRGESQPSNLKPRQRKQRAAIWNTVRPTDKQTDRQTEILIQRNDHSLPGRTTHVRKVPVHRVQEAGGQDGRAPGRAGRAEE